MIAAAKRFIHEAIALQSAGANETRIRDNFTSYLRQMFPDNPRWVTDHVQGAERNVHLVRSNRTVSGFIDNCIDSIAIEYEKNLEISAVFEEGYRQVKEYCAALINEGTPIDFVLGILSDTINWYVYTVTPNPLLSPGNYNQDNIQLTEIDSLHIDSVSDEHAIYLLNFLKRHLGREGARQITAQSIASDFGLQSIYSEPYRARLYSYVDSLITSSPEYYQLIEDLWNKFVERHTNTVDNRDSYISEYYISVIAKLLCANLISKRALSSSDNELIQILNGAYFENRNIYNFVEYDYFGWLNYHIETEIPTLRAIQEDLRVYDFTRTPQEDLFGDLLVQLANRSQRLLLGQELTPRWLAKKLVGRVSEELVQGEYPRYLDMCCGSGSMIVETISLARGMINANMPHEEMISMIQNAITGFDIDPLAVMLAKINWLVNTHDLFSTADRITIPIYHADSLFYDNPLTISRDADGVYTTYLRLDDQLIGIPQFVISSDHSIFDTIVDKCYDCIHGPRIDRESFYRIIANNLQDFEISDENLTSIKRFSFSLFETLYELNAQGKNGVWAFMLKNSFRPSLLKPSFNGIVSNTPWLALSKIQSNPYKISLKELADTLSIRPTDSSFLHLELATVFLINSIQRYLQPGAYFGCILPDSVLAGFHHNKFRTGKFADGGIQANFTDIWELPSETFRNRAIVLFGKKERFTRTENYQGRIIESEQLSHDAEFHVLTDGNRTVWSRNRNIELLDAEIVYGFNQGADVLPRYLFFYNHEEQNQSYVISSISSNHVDNPYSYFLSNMHVGREYHVPSAAIPKPLFHEVLLSNVVHPFVVSCPPKALLFISKHDGVWNAMTDEEIISYPRSVINTNDAIKREFVRFKGVDVNMYSSTLNYRNKLQCQRFRVGDYIVVYGAGGSNICAAYYLVTEQNAGVVIDQTLYWTVVRTESEAIYLCALLNCPALNEIITAFQPRGAFGERHIHTLPIQYIPRFDEENMMHQRLVNITRELISELIEMTPARLLDPNNGLLSRRRSRIQEIMTNLNSYRDYSEVCENVLWGVEE